MMRRKRITLLMFTSLLLFSFSGCVNQHPKEETSTAAEAVDNYRIAATSVATCQVLEALGVEGVHVVGIPTSDDYTVPEVYQNATSLGSPMAPDMEILKSLNVDYVFTPNSLEGDLKTQYDNIGVKSYFLNLKSVDGLYESINEIGKMLGKSATAKVLCDEYEQFKLEFAEKNFTEKPPTVLILMGLPGSYVVATESSYAGSLVKLAGGINVYGDGEGTDFLNINVEDMLSKSPDIILRTSHALPKQVAAMFKEEFETNDIWKYFDAVKNEKVYDLDNEKFGMSATFEYKEALVELESILYED